MENLYFSADGSASAWASTKLYELGFVGTVRFATDSIHGSAVRHECLRFRNTRQEALADARTDAGRLVKMWAEERERLDDH